MAEKVYFRSNESFESLMQANNIAFKENYSIETFRNLKLMMNTPLLYVPRKRTYAPTNRDEINTIFLDFIRSLGSKDIMDYYKSRIGTIDIKFEKLAVDGAYLDILLFDGLLYASSIVLPKNCFDERLLESFSHEMGHIPCYENKDRNEVEYFEYTEALPILFEYFMSCYLDSNYGKEHFMTDRLSLEKQAALAFLRDYEKYNSCTKREQNKKKYFFYELISSYKYFTSSDLALNMIDLASSDYGEVIKSLEKVVTGTSSMKSVSESFNIDTTGCKRLVKEYERRI